MAVDRRNENLWSEMTELNNSRRRLNENPPGGTSGGMDTVDAKIAAAEARTDTKFAQLIGRMDQMNDRLGRIESDNLRTRATVRNSALALAGLMIAIAAFALNGLAGAFNFGSKIDDMVHQEVVQAVVNQSVAAAPAQLPAPAKMEATPKR